jgi:hypothetical protein
MFAPRPSAIGRMPAVMTIDTFAEAEALVDGFGPPGAGSDAERRAASYLGGRLRDLGREVELEPFSAWPRWPLAYAIHAGLAVAGSVLAVDMPVAGGALVLVAVLLTLLDASGTLPTTRRLLGRRASQNVVSWGDREAPAALLLVAHYDSGRGGIVRSERRAGCWPRAVASWAARSRRWPSSSGRSSRCWSAAWRGSPASKPPG